MIRNKVKCILVIAAVICTGHNTIAQTYVNPASIAWRKQVARELDIQEPGAGKAKQNKKPGSDTTLLAALLKDIQSGKIAAYSNIDHSFSARMTYDQILENSGCIKPDTEVVADPVTGKRIKKLIKHDSPFDAIHKYRILEDWTFNRETGTTEIHIEGIAPLQEISGNDFSAVKALFWIRYNDLAQQLVRFEKLHLGQALTDYIWEDYFPNDAKPAEKKTENTTWKKHEAHILDIDPEDTKKHPLRDMGSDSSLFEAIDYEVLAGQLSGYDSLGNKLTKSDLFGKPDTVYLVDPVTGYTVYKTATLPHSYGRASKFKFIEDWSFDQATGNTTIKLNKVVPVIQDRDNTGNPGPYKNIYWLNFEDVSPIIAKYEQTHYNNSLANLLWNDYFINDQKPAEKK